MSDKQYRILHIPTGNSFILIPLNYRKTMAFSDFTWILDSDISNTTGWTDILETVTKKQWDILWKKHLIDTIYIDEDAYEFFPNLWWWDPFGRDPKLAKYPLSKEEFELF